MDLGIAGRTYIVTGGSAGIGLGTVSRLAMEGANVVAAARRAGHLEEALRQADPSGERTLAVAQDMIEEEAAERLSEAALERFGRIDGIVNNVGTSIRGAFTDLTDEQWLQDINLKLFPAIRLIRTAMPELTARGIGSVVNVLSIGGKQPGAGTLPTSATRSAGLALTKALSKELAPNGVRVNAVCVGLIRSEQHDRRRDEQAPSMTDDEWYAQLTDQRSIPMGRAGVPDEVAATISLLLSDRAGFTSGTAINVDGGQSAVW